MSKSVQMTLKCEDPGDGSGDDIINLPSDVLTAMSVGLGDLLSLELVEGVIVLKPIHDTDTNP